MVVALLALSLVMILGGVAAVVQGFPYVRLESGLAMVIGGSTAASAGVILLGLSAVVDRLRRVQRAIIGLREEGFQQPSAGPSMTEAPSWLAAPDDSPLATPSIGSSAAPAGPMAGAAGLAGLGALSATRSGGRGSEPVFEDPEPADVASREVEPLLPDLLPEPEAPQRVRPDDEIQAVEKVSTPNTKPEPSLPTAEGLGLRPALDLPAEEASSAAAQQPGTRVDDGKSTEATAEGVHASDGEPERHAVGSYSSGANTYVMFSDGSIEADTPRGRFTFGSLDELKSFVNAGGEEARGAA